LHHPNKKIRIPFRRRAMTNLICAILVMLIISGCSNGGMQTSTIEGVRFNGIVVGSSHALSGVCSALVSSPLSASGNLYIPDKFILDKIIR